MRREQSAAAERPSGPSEDSTRVRRIGRPRREGIEECVARGVLDRLKRVGYARLRIDDVAAEAGVAKTTLYRRWPSKEALVADVVSHLYLGRIQPVDRGGLREDLVALLGETRELLFEGVGRVLEDLVRESGSHPELAGVVRATNDARRHAYVEAIERGVARGELAPAIEPGFVVDLLVGPLWTRLLVTGGVVTRGEVEAIVDGVLDGVRTARGA